MATCRFTELPAFLAGLRLEDLSRLRLLILTEGTPETAADQDETYVVRCEGPLSLVFRADVRDDRTDLTIDLAGGAPDELVDIDLSGTPFKGRLRWNWFVQLDHVLQQLAMVDGATPPLAPQVLTC